MRKMVIFLFLLGMTLLYGSMYGINPLEHCYPKNQSSRSSRLEYGVDIDYLPPPLSMALILSEDCPVSQNAYEWDLENEEWVLEYTFNYSYSEGLLSQYEALIPMQGETYQSLTSLTWEDGMLTESITEVTFMGNTYNQSRDFYTYDANGCLTEYELEMFEPGNGIWMDGIHWQITLDNNIATEILEEEFDYDEMLWVPETRFSFTYSEGLIATAIEEFYDGGSWYNDMKKNFYYLAGDFRDYVLRQMWVGNVWEDYDRTTYTYENDLHIYDITHSWEENAWVNDEENYNTYDDEDRVTHVHQNEFMDGEWVNESEFDIFYTVETEESEITTADILLKAYPNPFNPVTTISWQVETGSKPEKLSIYDLKGRKITELSITTNENGQGSVIWQGIDDTGNDLAAGIYFYSLVGYERTGKIILLK